MTKNRFALLVLSVILLTALVGCGTPVPASTPTPIPTNTTIPTNTPTTTPTMTATPWGADVVQLILAIGFHEDETYGCEPAPCRSYVNDTNTITVVTFDNGVDFAFDVDKNISFTAAEMDRILVPIYGSEVDSWVADHLKAAQSAPQVESGNKLNGVTGEVNGFSVTVAYSYDSIAGAIYFIRVRPAGLPTETPVPTPTTNPLSSVLLENGFVRNKNNGAEYYCNIPCEYYEHLIPDRADTVTLYNDGSFEMSSVAFTKSVVPEVNQLMSTVVSAIYGPEFGQWVSQQSNLPDQGAVHTTISGRKVDLTQYTQQDPQAWTIKLSIGPKTGN
jgi:hypothetical protein